MDLAAELEKQREEIRQIVEYENLLMERRLFDESRVREMESCWMEKWHHGNHPNDRLKAAFRRFLRMLPKTEVIDAIDVTFERFPDGTFQCEKFFCGVCWRKFKNPPETERYVCEGLQPNP